MFFYGKTNDSVNSQKKGGFSSQKSNVTDKSSKSKTDENSEIPHYSDMIEYLVSQKGSRHMQEFVKKEQSNLEIIDKIIERIQNDFGKLMID